MSYIGEMLVSVYAKQALAWAGILVIAIGGFFALRHIEVVADRRNREVSCVQKRHVIEACAAAKGCTYKSDELMYLERWCGGIKP